MREEIDKIVENLRSATEKWREPIVTEMSRMENNPFKILISTLISLRTKDDVTREASKRLFFLGDKPEIIINMDNEEIEKAIYPAGFYKNKAKTIKEVSKEIVDNYSGIVPDDIEKLLSMKGVGRKTANLVMTKGFGKPGICVDTHVHRIMNRIGYVKTKDPNETEFALREKLPEKYWIEINDLLVSFGQNLCKPISPHCSNCPIHDLCRRIGVTNHR
jgi:endonuclease III